jgi:D-ribose pyranase
MRKHGLLNQPLISVIASMGHTDMLVIADAGLPIPSTTQRIDLALVAGIPSLVDVLNAILSEMQVESAIIATELATHSPTMHTTLTTMLRDIQAIENIPHETFKRRTAQAKAVIRTGEFTPYANIILVAGVTF